MAVQVGLPEKAETVKAAGAASETLAEVGEGVPEAQEKERVTEERLVSEKSLMTVNVAVVVLVMVQEPIVKNSAQVPEEE